MINNVYASGSRLEDEYLPLLQKYVAGARKRATAGETGLYQTSDEVAKVIVDVALSDSPPFRTRTFDWSNDFCRLKTSADPDGSKLVQEEVDRFMK